MEAMIGFGQQTSQLQHINASTFCYYLHMHVEGTELPALIFTFSSITQNIHTKNRIKTLPFSSEVYVTKHNDSHDRDEYQHQCHYSSRYV